MTGIKAVSCQKTTAAFSCLSVTCQQPWLCTDKCSSRGRSPGNGSKQSSSWGKERLRQALELSLHLVWQAWRHIIFIFDSWVFILKQAAALAAALARVAGHSWGQRGAPGDGQPRGHTTLTTSLSWGHTTRLKMGVTLLEKLMSSNSHHADRKTGSADAHGNLFSKGRLTPYPAEIAQGSSVSRNPRTSNTNSCLKYINWRTLQLLLGC